MNIEREELELAALAAGYEFNSLWYDEVSGLSVWEPARDNFESRDWNPKHDEGDCFRLMHKLKMRVSHPLVVAWTEDRPFSGFSARLPDDPTKEQLREAIFQVAVEAGRLMKESNHVHD